MTRRSTTCRSTTPIWASTEARHDGPVGFDLALLAAASSVTLFYETTIDGDLVNTATGVGDAAESVPDPTDDDTAEVDEVAPAIWRSTRRCTRVMTRVRRVRARSRCRVRTVTRSRTASR